MKLQARAGTLLLVAIVVAQGAWLAAPTVRDLIFPPLEDPAERGYVIAEDLGCFSCHGPEGVGGIENPGSYDGVIPALSGGEMMMWADSEDQLREWILYGRLLEEDEEERSGLAAGQATDRALVMPAFEPYLTAGELDDLVAYVKSISGLQFPEDKAAAKGLELVHKLGCFRCHGAMGTGGVSNPASLKGYVPGFFGEDYAELVADDGELEQWIRNGISDRFANDPLAKRVIAGQALKMPAYGEFLEDEEIDQLLAVVRWLASDEWRAIPVP